MSDEKYLKAALVLDGALAGVAAFYSIPGALLIIALLVFAAVRL